MQLLKFSLLFFLSFSSYAEFKDIDCIKQKFNTTINHGSEYLGLVKKNLNINKDVCLIDVTTKEKLFFKNKWSVDTCREPVHIKKGDRSIEVLRKRGVCRKNSVEPFCLESKKIIDLLLDRALIFAKGDKGNLKDEHGKMYCVYIMLKTYLEKGYALSKQDKFNTVSLRDRKDDINNKDSEDDIESEENIVEDKAVNKEESKVKEKKPDSNIISSDDLITPI